MTSMKWLQWDRRQSAPQIAPLSPASEGMFGRPKRAASGNGIPVIIVTGFLGAGKTTLIRSLLDSQEGANSAIIVNEFGEVVIDDAILRTGSDATVLLGNGCVCCRRSSELETILRGLFIDRSRGAVPSFERVLIETSGLVDPGPILQSFLAGRSLHETYGLQQVVTVIDAVNGAANMDKFPEACRQVGLADLIVITKTDLVSQSAIERLQAKLRPLNAAARIIFATAGQSVLKAMISGNLMQALDTRAAMEHAGHTAGVGSYVLTFDKPLNWPAFAVTMQALCSLRGADLLRVKGLLAVNGARGPVAVHYVQHLAHPPVELRDWPADDDRRSKLVFITRNIDKQAVTELFAALSKLRLQASEEKSHG